MFNEYDVNKDETISFDEFLTFMKKRRADTDTKDEILAAFRDISNGKEAITVDELSTVMPREQAEYLGRNMPQKEGGGLDFSKWAEQAFQ